MLDTNIISDIMRHPRGRAGERAISEGEALCISAIVAAELRYGCAKKASPELTRRVEEFLSEVEVLPFAPPADRHYGTIRARLEAAGRMIGPNDLLIAAHAVSLDATVVTAKVNEFRRVEGLPIENWLL